MDADRYSNEYLVMQLYNDVQMYSKIYLDKPFHIYAITHSDNYVPRYIDNVICPCISI